MEEWIWRYSNRVWKEEGWPEGWKEGVIVPIVKKGKREKVEEYRRVTLMDTLYKIYVGVLAESLKEEVNEKETIPRNKTGFRKRMRRWTAFM